MTHAQPQNSRTENFRLADQRLFLTFPLRAKILTTCDPSPGFHNQKTGGFSLESFILIFNRLLIPGCRGVLHLKRDAQQHPARVQHAEQRHRHACMQETSHSINQYTNVFIFIEHRRQYNDRPKQKSPALQKH